MNDYLISLFIDNELNLDEKTSFVKTVRDDANFADETLSLLDQEKLLRSDVTDVIPPVVLTEKKRGFSIWKRGYVNFAAGITISLLCVFVFFQYFKTNEIPLTAHRIPYRFVIYQPEVKKAEIVGSFTGWRPITMTSVDDYWQITLELPPGEHRFAYIFDDQEQVSDPTIPIREKDDFGGENSILEVQWSV